MDRVSRILITWEMDVSAGIITIDVFSFRSRYLSADVYSQTMYRTSASASRHFPLCSLLTASISCLFPLLIFLRPYRKMCTVRWSLRASWYRPVAIIRREERLVLLLCPRRFWWIFGAWRFSADDSNFWTSVFLICTISLADFLLLWPSYV